MTNKILAGMWALRKMNVGLIADQIFSARTAVSQVLSGKRSGKQTWKKLRRVLTEEEYVIAREFAYRQRTKEPDLKADECEMLNTERRELITQFQTEHKANVTGEMDEATLKLLREMSTHRRPESAEAEQLEPA
jgi:predicted transcriptional regulator